MKNGAYFDIRTKDNFVIKTLVKKEGGSIYPSFDLFSEKISLLKEYLGDFIVNTEIVNESGILVIKQPFIHGVCIFTYLNNNLDRPNKFSEFVKKLHILYKKTNMLPDLLNEGNILVDKLNNIKIVDVWPVFFKERVSDLDLNIESYNENLERLNRLTSLIEK